MLILLSPSKTQDFESPPPRRALTIPALLDESEILVTALKKLSKPKLEKLMKISPALAELNHERFAAFHTPFNDTNARAAIDAFRGDVYDGLNSDAWDAATLKRATAQLRILSGLYGALRPLDMIQPYRLEMKTPLKTRRGADLYHFWKGRIADHLPAGKPIVNLASQEYFKAVAPYLSDTVITPQFKEQRGREVKMIALFAKQARGAMASAIVAQGWDSPKQLQKFDWSGYRFDASLSSPESPVFVRKSR